METVTLNRSLWMGWEQFRFAAAMGYVEAIPSATRRLGLLPKRRLAILSQWKPLFTVSDGTLGNLLGSTAAGQTAAGSEAGLAATAGDILGNLDSPDPAGPHRLITVAAHRSVQRSRKAPTCS